MESFSFNFRHLQTSSIKPTKHKLSCLNLFSSLITFGCRDSVLTIPSLQTFTYEINLRFECELCDEYSNLDHIN